MAGRVLPPRFGATTAAHRAGGVGHAGAPHGAGAPPHDELEPPQPLQAWPALTAYVWNAWRDAPVTVLWTSSDLSFAVDTIALHALSSTSKASEIRLRMESLGLTPKRRADRRLLLPERGTAR